MNAAQYWLPAPPRVRVFRPDLLPMEGRRRCGDLHSPVCDVGWMGDSIRAHQQQYRYGQRTDRHFRPIRQSEAVSLNGVTQSTFSYAIPAGGSIHPRSTGRKRSVAVLKSFHRYADGLLSGPIPRSVRRSGDQCVISLLRFKTRVPFVSECSGR